MTLAGNKLGQKKLKIRSNDFRYSNGFQTFLRSRLGWIWSIVKTNKTPKNNCRIGSFRRFLIQTSLNKKKHFEIFDKQGESKYYWDKKSPDDG